MTESIRVFVNAAPVDVSRGATAIECVRAWRGDEADAVSGGTRVITDSRGLPVSSHMAAHAGAIFRTVAARGAPSDG